MIVFLGSSMHQITGGTYFVLISDGYRTRFLMGNWSMSTTREHCHECLATLVPTRINFNTHLSERVSIWYTLDNFE